MTILPFSFFPFFFPCLFFSSNGYADREDDLKGFVLNHSMTEGASNRVPMVKVERVNDNVDLIIFFTYYVPPPYHNLLAFG